MALISWDSTYEGLPLGSEAMSTVDEIINELKENIGRRWEQGGHVLTQDPRSLHSISPPVNANDGRHVVDSGGSGVSPHIYQSDGTTKLVDYTDSGVTITAGKTLTADGVTSGDSPGHNHFATLLHYTNAGDENHNDSYHLQNTGAWPRPYLWATSIGSKGFEIESAAIICRNTASTGNLIINIRKLASGWTDPGTEAVAGAGTFCGVMSIAAGQYKSSWSIVGASGLIAPNELVFLDTITVPTAGTFSWGTLHFHVKVN